MCLWNVINSNTSAEYSSLFVNLNQSFQEIDHMMLRVQEQGYKSLAQFGGRAFTYVSNFVMQTAIKVRTKTWCNIPGVGNIKDRH